MSESKEAALIERMWGLICNSSDLKSGLRWERRGFLGLRRVPVATGLSTSEDSVEWRKVMRDVRIQYHNWLDWYIYTHRTDTPEPTIGEMIDALNSVCNCGVPDCNAAVLDRDMANALIERLRGIAVQERDSSTAG